MRMISYLAAATRRAIKCNPNPRSPTPLALSLCPDGVGYLPSLESFIGQLIRTCDMDKDTLTATLLYLRRLKSRLPPNIRGLRCTAHRMFLAALILADKYINDNSRFNKHWAISSHTNTLHCTALHCTSKVHHSGPHPPLQPPCPPATTPRGLCLFSTFPQSAMGVPSLSAQRACPPTNHPGPLLPAFACVTDMATVWISLVRFFFCV
jgi:hypothetical protein